MQNHRCPTIEEFKDILKKHSLKATPQRLAVHEAMIVLGHACADMVTEEISKQGKAKVTVASVYNILSQLALLGIYHHRMSCNNKMYFDVNVYEHAHFYDQEENSYMDFHDPELVRLVMDYLSTKQIEKFDVKTVDIQLVGKKTDNQ